MAEKVNKFKKAAEKRHLEQENLLVDTGIKKTRGTKKAVLAETTGNDATLMIYLPEALKRELKVYAAQNNKSVAVVLREWIEEKLNS